MSAVRNTTMRAVNAMATSLYRRSHGKIGGKARGVRVMLITVRGRKTGTPHTTPVSYFEHDGGYLVIGSAGGAKQDPQWIRNLAAAGSAHLELGPTKLDVTAQVLSGAERDTAWNDVIVAQAPFFAKYEQKSGRTIPVARLTPNSA